MRSRGHLVLIGACVWLGLLSCLDLPSKGQLNEACFDDGTCTEGLQCRINMCVSPLVHDGGSHDGGKDAAAPEDAGQPEDAGHRDTGHKDTGGGPDAEMDAEADAEVDDIGGGDGGLGDAGDGGDTGGATDAGAEHEDAATADAGDAGVKQDAGAEIEDASTTGDAGDPCDNWSCLCDSYCKVAGGIPTCVNGCLTSNDCCSGHQCSGAVCQ